MLVKQVVHVFQVRILIILVAQMPVDALDLGQVV